MQNQDTPSHQGLSQDEARALCRRILALSQAQEARVSLQSGRRSFTRYADNRITTAGESTDTAVEITSVFGQQAASVTTNRLSDAALSATVRRSEELARLAPANPELMPELEAQEYVDVQGYSQATGSLPPEAAASVCAHAIERAKEVDARAAGFIDLRAGAQTVATSRGLFAHHLSTGVASTLTMRTADGASSGWAGGESSGWRHIDTEGLVEAALSKCLDWRGAARLEPGRYVAILEPTAVGMLLLRMLNALDERFAHEGRSYFSKPGGGSRLGESLFDTRVTLASDPTASGAETAPFDGQGQPRSRQVWVEGGTLKNLSCSRFWAQRQNLAPRPTPANLLMSGGEETLEEMIASTPRGVLITRFWYIRGLNPRTVSYTGLTRDGTFLIEDGRVRRPVNNFRFNQSLVEMLKNIEAMGRPQRVAAAENSSVGVPIVVPALKVRDFYLSSLSDAV